jgi:hypothetical protein
MIYPRLDGIEHRDVMDTVPTMYSEVLNLNPSWEASILWFFYEFPQFLQADARVIGLNIS